MILEGLHLDLNQIRHSVKTERRTIQTENYVFCFGVMDRAAPDAHSSAELMLLSRAVINIGRALVAQ